MVKEFLKLIYIASVSYFSSLEGLHNRLQQKKLKNSAIVDSLNSDIVDCFSLFLKLHAILSSHIDTVSA